MKQRLRVRLVNGDEYTFDSEQVVWSFDDKMMVIWDNELKKLMHIPISSILFFVTESLEDKEVKQ